MPALNETLKENNINIFKSTRMVDFIRINGAGGGYVFATNADVEDSNGCLCGVVDWDGDNISANSGTDYALVLCNDHVFLKVVFFISGKVEDSNYLALTEPDVWRLHDDFFSDVSHFNDDDFERFRSTLTRA